MPSNSLRRAIYTAPFIENGQYIVDIPRGYDLNALTFIIKGTVTLSTAATALKGLAPSQLLNRVELFADGNTSFQTATGAQLLFSNFERGLSRTVVQPGITVAEHDIYVAFRMDAVTADGLRPKDSAIHTRRPYMSLLQAGINFGAVADIFDGGVVSASDLTLEIVTDEAQEIGDAGYYEARLVKRVSLQTMRVASDNSNAKITLPVGSKLRGVKIIAKDENGEPSNDVVNSVSVESGVDVRLKLGWEQLRAFNMEDFNIADGDLLDGVAFADLMADGRLTGLYDLTAKSEATVTLDVTKPAGGDGTVEIQVIEYYNQPAQPVPGAGTV